MKSTKFIQLFDADKKPILSTQGVLSFDKRSKSPTSRVNSLKRAKKIPKEAVYFSIRQMVLNSIQNVTPLYIV